MSRLTEEQAQVVASRATLLAVDAFAGTGKTLTLVEYARARPGSRILYVAFNRSVAAEARERFPDHVDCRTTHSLAFGAVGKRFQDKLGNAQPYEVAQLLNCNPRRAKAVLETVGAWLCSVDPEISIEHVDRASFEEEIEAAAVADQARAVWEHMENPRAALKMPHDGYLKLWAMSKPRLRFDTILLDEAQDTNPITLDLVLNQRHATIVLVGDRHQGIYGFRKALNAMEAVNAEERVALTQSFRFGQGVADIATELLQRFKGESHAVKGRADTRVRWRVDTTKHYAMVGRTNAGLFAAAAQVVLADPGRRLHFVGGFDGYPFGKVLDAYHLWADERPKIKDAAIARFPGFAEFRRYGDEADDAEVKALVRVVEEYRSQIPRIYAAMKAAEMPVETRANITLTTAHKAKGLEWDQVHLADDFIELPASEETDPEEINLLYVALTRAISAVRLPANMTEWLQEIDRPAGEAANTSNCAELPSAAGGHEFEDDHARERWLRENLRSFGQAADDVAFLLDRLDQARQLACDSR